MSHLQKGTWPCYLSRLSTVYVAGSESSLGWVTARLKLVTLLRQAGSLVLTAELGVCGACVVSAISCSEMGRYDQAIELAQRGLALGRELRSYLGDVSQAVTTGGGTGGGGRAM